MAGKYVDVFYHLRLSQPRGGAADAAIERDLQATDPALVGADAEEPRRHHAIETGPTRMGNFAEEDGGGGRHHGDRVIDPKEDAFELQKGLSVEMPLLIRVHGVDCMPGTSLP